MKHLIGVLAAGLALSCTTISASPDSDASPVHHENGKAIVAAGTLMCKSEASLKRIQSAIYRQHRAEEKRLLESDDCTIADRKFVFHDIDVYDEDTLQSVTPMGNSNRQHFICRHSYASAVKTYLAQNES